MIRNSSRSAALLAPQPVAASVEGATGYGEALGMAFQVTDDVLDFYESKVTGKPTQGDLRSGIITAPLLYACEENPRMRALLEPRNGPRTDEECARVMELLGTTQGMARATALARSYADQAKEALTALPPSHSRDVLAHLADRVVTRSH